MKDFFEVNYALLGVGLVPDPVGKFVAIPLGGYFKSRSWGGRIMGAGQCIGYA